MEMSLEQYILNPALKTNAILNATTRELIKKSYQTKFNNIMLRENGKVTYYLFTQGTNVFWAYIKVPSEVVHNFYYDVIFKFTPTNNTGFFEDLFKFNVRFFSNDPNFVFTFAYVFKDKDLFIDELTSRMSKEALTKHPEEKNPTEVIGYEKAIYFAYLIMKERKLNRLLKFKGEATPLDTKFLLQNITHADDKIKEREEEGKKYSKKKKAVISKEVAKNLSSFLNKEGKAKLATSNIKVTGNTKRIPTITRANSIKITKKSPKK